MSNPKILKVIIAVVISAVANMLIMLIVANWLIDLVTVTPQEIKQYEERMAAERLDRPINENGSFEIRINQPGITGSFNVSSIVDQENPGTIGSPNIYPMANYPFAVGSLEPNPRSVNELSEQYRRPMTIFFCPNTEDYKKSHVVLVRINAPYSEGVIACNEGLKTPILDAVINQRLNNNFKPTP
ncbi:MAG: hypothetical protein GPJ10_01555 [Microcystis aeruginosa L211-07]|nr:hypothetical protein [Microcystis aeruginosa L211-07]